MHTQNLCQHEKHAEGAGVAGQVLGTGSLPVKLEIKAASFSKSALAKIEEAGGKAEVIPQRPK